MDSLNLVCKLLHIILIQGKLLQETAFQIDVYIPPALISARKTMNEDLFMNAAMGTLQLIFESGFSNTNLFNS